MATTTDKYILELETAKAERGIERTQKGFGGMLAGLGRLGPAAAAAGAALAGVAAVKGIGDKINEMDSLIKAAAQAGAADSNVAFERFQVLGRVLDEAGVSADRYSLAMSQTQDRLAKGGTKIDGVIEKLGSSLKNMDGSFKSGPELLEAMIIAFKNGEVSAEEFQAVVGSKVGPEIVRALGATANSAESLGAAMADVAANSDIISKDGADNAAAFNDTMGRIKEVLGQVGTTIVTALLPYLNEMAEGVLANLPAIVDGVKGAFSALEPVFSLIGTVIKDILWPALSLVFDILGAVAGAIAPLVESAVPLLVGIFEKLASVVQGVIEFFKSAIEIMGNIATKVRELAGAVTGAFSGMGKGITDTASKATGAVTGFFKDMYTAVVGNSYVPDMASGVTSSFSSMKDSMINLTGQAITGVKNTMSNLAQAVGSKFEELTGISMSGLKEQVSSMSNYLTSSVSSLASSIGSKLSGLWNRVSSTASSVGDLFGGFSFSNPFDNFAGFFAKGGMIPAGQFGVVGESGPELVGGPANVTPMSGIGGNVTYNINAVDASSFRSLLAQDPEFVHRVVQRGSNSANMGRR